MPLLEGQIQELCREMGMRGEGYVRARLAAKYAPPRYAIVTLHNLLELDCGVLDLSTNQFTEIHEVKTTTREDYHNFLAGGPLQIKCFSLQYKKKEKGAPYIPFYLDVVLVEKEFFITKKLKVKALRQYTMKDLIPVHDKEGRLGWKIKRRP